MVSMTDPSTGDDLLGRSFGGRENVRSSPHSHSHRPSRSDWVGCTTSSERKTCSAKSRCSSTWAIGRIARPRWTRQARTSPVLSVVRQRSRRAIPCSTSAADTAIRTSSGQLNSGRRKSSVSMSQPSRSRSRAVGSVSEGSTIGSGTSTHRRWICRARTAPARR